MTDKDFFFCKIQYWKDVTKIESRVSLKYCPLSHEEIVEKVVQTQDFACIIYNG